MKLFEVINPNVKRIAVALTELMPKNGKWVEDAGSGFYQGTRREGYSYIYPDMNLGADYAMAKVYSERVRNDHRRSSGTNQPRSTMIDIRVMLDQIIFKEIAGLSNNKVIDLLSRFGKASYIGPVSSWYAWDVITDAH